MFDCPYKGNIDITYQFNTANMERTNKPKKLIRLFD